MIHGIAYLASPALAALALRHAARLIQAMLGYRHQRWLVEQTIRPGAPAVVADGTDRISLIPSGAQLSARAEPGGSHRESAH